MKCWYSKPPYAGAVPHSKKSTGTKTRTSNIVNGGNSMTIKNTYYLVLNKYKKDIEYIIQIRYIQVLMYKNRKGQKTKPNQDKKESHMTHLVPTQIAEIISTSPSIFGRK